MAGGGLKRKGSPLETRSFVMAPGSPPPTSDPACPLIAFAKEQKVEDFILKRAAAGFCGLVAADERFAELSVASGVLSPPPAAAGGVKASERSLGKPALLFACISSRPCCFQVLAQTYDPADEKFNEMLLSYVFCVGLANKLYGITHTDWTVWHGLYALGFPNPKKYFQDKHDLLARKFKVFVALDYKFPLVAEEEEEQAAAGSSSLSAC